jgi:hypothetical protein
LFPGCKKSEGENKRNTKLFITYLFILYIICIFVV